MLKFTGKGVYGAIAVGKASVFFKKKKTKIRRTGIVDIEAEFARVEAAKAKAAEELSLIYEKALREVGETNAQIFDLQQSSATLHPSTHSKDSTISTSFMTSRTAS